MATTTKNATAKKDTVTIMLPKLGRNQENFETASVNGKVYRIKRGVQVEVPPEIAEVLYNAQMADADADNYIESKQ